MSARELWREFRAFALKGNVIDLAVAVIIGNAFGGLVKSLSDHVLTPILGYVLPAEEGYRAWKVGRVELGAFLADAVNFAVISVTMFLLMVKVLGALKRSRFLASPGEPTTRECPLCLSVIPLAARKCAHCTADLPEPA